MDKAGFKTIIVGADLSPYSRTVVRQAEQFRRAHKAKLVIVHSTLGFSHLTGPVTFKVVSEELLSELKDLLLSYYRIKESNDVTLVVRYGAPADVLVKLAHEYPNPLLVVGHRGHNALASFFLGSTAERVALQAPCPVWVHRGNKVRLPHKILVPIDMSRMADQVVQWVMKWAKVIPLKSESFFVRPELAPFLDYGKWVRLQERLVKRTDKMVTETKRKYPQWPLAVRSGDPAKEILSRARLFDAVVMSPHNKSGLFNTFGAVTSKVLKASPAPVLVIPKKALTERRKRQAKRAQPEALYQEPVRLQ